MNIYVCKYAGLCLGARIAVDAAYENLDENLYMYGEVLHNPDVIDELKRGGGKIIRTVNEVKYLENKKEIKVLIRAHGVAKEIIDELERNEITYIDKTCREVKKIHNIVYEMSKRGYEIIIIGDRKHPEIIGTMGWSVSRPIVLKDFNEVKDELPNLDKSKSYCVVAQTTYNSKKYNDIVEYCKKFLKNAQYFETVCLDTENRQIEIKTMAQKADTIIVIGGKNSSNTNKLYKIALNNCGNVQFIENYKELDFSNINEESYVVITGGASTPEKAISEVIKCLRDYEKDMKSVLI